MGRLSGLAAAAVIVLAAPAAAPTTTSDEWRPVPGGFVSGAVEYVGTIATEAGGAVDAVLHDGLLYVTSWRSFSIYDVTDPLAHERLSTTPLAVGALNEQPQTNGEILLISRDLQYLPPTEEVRGGGVLDIYDVSDPSEPVLLSTFESRLVGPFRTHRDHLWTCVLDCAYAYSAGGTILDLRDPSEPTFVGLWTDVAPPRDGRIHHVGEVAPGIVLTGSLPMYVLDARDAPDAPTVLGSFEPETSPTGPLVDGPAPVPNPIANPETLPARSAWPSGLRGRLAVVSMETPFTGNCTERSGDVQTFRVTRGAHEEPTFELADRYHIGTNGTYTDGAPPYNVLGCSSYGLDLHPDFAQAGGLAAVSFFEHGVRILDIDGRGSITERGGFVPLAGNSTAPRWLADDLVFVTDLHRGVDILRVGPASLP